MKSLWHPGYLSEERVTYSHVIHSINHVTKRRTPLLDEDSVIVAKVGQWVC